MTKHLASSVLLFLSFIIITGSRGQKVSPHASADTKKVITIFGNLKSLSKTDAVVEYKDAKGKIADISFLINSSTKLEKVNIGDSIFVTYRLSGVNKIADSIAPPYYPAAASPSKSGSTGGVEVVIAPTPQIIPPLNSDALLTGNTPGDTAHSTNPELQPVPGGEVLSDAFITTFMEAVGKDVYIDAWPTAQFRKYSIEKINRVPGGADVSVKLDGLSSFDESDQWVKLTFLFRDGELKDLRVSDHNAILMPPFSTSKLLSQGSSRISAKYNALRAARTSDSSSPKLDKPSWQMHIDWAATDASNPDCPELYIGENLAACVSEEAQASEGSVNRQCAIKRAASLAMSEDPTAQKLAFRYVLLTQCHDSDAQKNIQSVGERAVVQYLRSLFR